MLRSMKSLFGTKILAIDGEIGYVHDFFFDDESWVIRYLVVDTGSWLPERKVLLSPEVLGAQDWNANTFSVDLTREQVKSSPDIDVNKPVSRQHETKLHQHYGWDYYWLPGAHHWAGHVSPPPAAKKEERPPVSGSKPEVDYHLRSAKEVIGYHIQATDGKIGHVEDFIIDLISLIIRYMIVDTRDWLPGRKVLVSPAWVENVSWGDSKVYVNLTQEEIKYSPEFNPSDPVNRRYEERLYDYYGRPKYWS
jgi:uncharacterized protein YrrD